MTPATEELLVILLSWSAHLSGYPAADLPEIRFEPHAFFVEHACGGQECNVEGWYNDEGVVYIDDRFTDVNDGYTSSLIVHEFTHFLQHKSGAFDSLSCEDSVAREREAYYVQTLYVIESLTSVRIVHRRLATCNYSEKEDHAVEEGLRKLSND